MWDAALDAAGLNGDVLGVTVKAGDNDGGSDEGKFYDLVESDDLTMGTTDKADFELAAADHADWFA